MYAYTTRTPVDASDFELPVACDETAYWRNHPNLHGWFEALYRAAAATPISTARRCGWMRGSSTR